MRSPCAAIREGFSVGWLAEDEGWLLMLELRNLSSHTYNEDLVERIYAELPGMLALFRQLLATLDAQA